MVDIPIGFGPRKADGVARAFLSGAASTVFSTPAREVLEGPFGPGLGVSAQAHALGPRIVHVTDSPSLIHASTRSILRFLQSDERQASLSATAKGGPVVLSSGSSFFARMASNSRASRRPPRRLTTCSTPQQRHGARIGSQEVWLEAFPVRRSSLVDAPSLSGTRHDRSLDFRLLDETAEGVREAHLLDGSTVRVQEPRARD